MENRTRQRAAIRGVLQNESRPLTAGEIHRLARTVIPTLGLSTVYRSIRRMVHEQQLIGVDFPGQPPRYELPTRNWHSHFICSGCDKVFDLPGNPEISPVPLPTGFRSHGFELVVFGFCDKCGESAASNATPRKD